MEGAVLVSVRMPPDNHKGSLKKHRSKSTSNPTQKTTATTLSGFHQIFLHTSSSFGKQGSGKPACKNMPPFKAKLNCYAMCHASWQSSPGTPSPGRSQTTAPREGGCGPATAPLTGLMGTRRLQRRCCRDRTRMLRTLG